VAAAILVPNKLSKAADRRGSEIKTPKARAGPNPVQKEKITIDYAIAKIDKYNEYKNDHVLRALDAYLCPECSDVNYPAPIGTSNDYVATTSCEGNITQVPNPSPASSTLASFAIQQGNPNAPLLVSGGTSNGTFNYYAEGAFQPTYLEVNKTGQQWGLLYDPTDSLYLLSDFNSNVHANQQVWLMQTPNSGGVINLNDAAFPAPFGMYGANLYWSNTANGTIAGNVPGISADAGALTLTCPAGKFIVGVSVNYGTSLFGYTKRLLTISASDGTGTILSVGQEPHVLAPLINTNFSFIKARSDRVRLNCSEFVATMSVQEYYQGGNFLSGQILSAQPPPANYYNYLYTMKHRRLADAKFGLGSLWFPRGEQWNMGPADEYPVNPFTTQSVVNMHILTYTNVSGNAVPFIDLQYKLTLWVDYTTSDTTVPTVPGIVWIDDWLTATSIVDALYNFTDNPNHTKVAKFLKDAVRYIMSDEKVPSALRKAGGVLVKDILPAVGALMLA